MIGKVGWLDGEEFAKRAGRTAGSYRLGLGSGCALGLAKMQRITDTYITGTSGCG